MICAVVAAGVWRGFADIGAERVGATAQAKSGTAMSVLDRTATAASTTVPFCGLACVAKPRGTSASSAF